MVGIAIPAAHYRAICSALPEGAPLWPVPSSGRPNCLIHIEAAVLDRLRAMRRPGGSYFASSLRDHPARDRPADALVRTMARHRTAGAGSGAGRTQLIYATAIHLPQILPPRSIWQTRSLGSGLSISWSGKRN